jgi:hypothetical protein
MESVLARASVAAEDVGNAATVGVEGVPGAFVARAPLAPSGSPLFVNILDNSIV